MLHKNILILVIEDDAEELFLLEQILSRMDTQGVKLQLKFARTLEEGKARFKEADVDVILLDLNLPDSEGIDTFETVKNQAPQTPIVILSLLHDDTLALEAVRRGAEDYLFKRETHPDLILRTIRYAIERHKLLKEVQAVHSQLEKFALLDPVTELFNQKGLQEILFTEIQRARRKNHNLLVLLVDLDDFNRINRSLGPTVGDVILKEVALRLKSSLRVTDYVARLGGDEFMVLLPETRLAEGIPVAEKIRLAISTTMVTLSTKHAVRITASLHLVNFPEIPLSVHELLARTHAEKYKNKVQGRNKVSYEPKGYVELGKEEKSELSVVAQMLRQDRFQAYMQSIFNLVDLTEVGYEFLSRSSIKGFEMPDDFFRVSLEANILTLVDYACLKICIQAAAVFPAPAQCHVNIFPSTLIGLPVQQLLEVFAMEHSKATYCIEISEQQIIGDPSYLAEPVDILKREGVLIAIDDLGFGRSCLESLILLEPDIVKIDKRCVSGVSQNMAHMRSLKRLLRMAKSLGAEVMAEGIESREDLDMLKYLGVKYGQGFFLGRPALSSPASALQNKSILSGGHEAGIAE